MFSRVRGSAWIGSPLPEHKTPPPFMRLSAHLICHFMLGVVGLVWDLFRNVVGDPCAFGNNEELTGSPEIYRILKGGG